MLTILFLSADSALAAVILRFLGVSRRDLEFACCALGFFDGMALVLGWALRGSLGGRMAPPPEWILVACWIVLSIFVANTGAKWPRVAITAVAVLFSIDNLIAGTQMGSIGAVAWTALPSALCTMLVCRVAFQCADIVAMSIRRVCCSHSPHSC